MTKVCAVILHNNSFRTVSSCIEAVKNQTRKPEIIIVVDNGSEEKEVQNLEKISGIILLKKTNLGVGAGHNAGWKYAMDQFKADYIWALEHDTIPKKDCLEILIEESVSQNSELDVCCAVEVNGLKFEEKKYYEWTSRGIYKIPDKTKLTKYYGGFSFNGLLISNKVIEAVGWLREDFFIGYEDIDYFTRLNKLGGRSLRVTSAHVHHNMYKNRRQLKLGNRVLLLPNSSLSRDYYSTRNGFAFLKMSGYRNSFLFRRLLVSIISTLLFGNNKLKRIRLKLKAFNNGVNLELGK